MFDNVLSTFFRGLLKLAKPPGKPAATRYRGRAVLQLEALEDRAVPTVLWIAQDDGIWSDGNNWVDTTALTRGRAPANGEPVIFDLGRPVGIYTGTNKNSFDDMNIIVGGLEVDLGFTKTVGFNNNTIVDGAVTIGDGNVGAAAGKTLSLSPSAPALFSWTGGTLGGQVTLGPGLTTTISGAATKTMAAGPVTNSGIINWQGFGSISSYGLFTNAGTFNIQNDANWIVGADSGAVIVNQGVMQKTGGAAPPALTGIGPDFENQGGLAVNVGTMVFGGNAKQTGGVTNVSAAATLGLVSGYFLYAGTLSGSGTINGDVTNGSLLMAGSGGVVHPGDSGQPGTLTITGNYSQVEAGTLLIDINAAGTAGKLVVTVNAGGQGGQVTLSGGLTVNRNTGWTPRAGTLTFLQANQLNGDFAVGQITYNNNSWVDDLGTQHSLSASNAGTSYQLVVN
jgi:hypothetical protein